MYGFASVILTATILSLLGVIAVCLRFHVRLRMTRTPLGIDDWLIAFSCLLVLGQSAAQITGMYWNSLALLGAPLHVYS